MPGYSRDHRDRRGQIEAHHPAQQQLFGLDRRQFVAQGCGGYHRIPQRVIEGLGVRSHLRPLSLHIRYFSDSQKRLIRLHASVSTSVEVA